MTELQIISIMVTASDIIVYYKNYVDLPAKIYTHDDANHLDHKDNGRNSQNVDFNLPSDAYTLLNIINQRLSAEESSSASYEFSYIHNISIDARHNTDNVYKLCCRTHAPLTVALLVRYGSPSDNYQTQQSYLEQEVTPLLQSIQYHIHKFFTSSKFIPIYILRIRCHTLIHKQLASYNTKRCCAKNGMIDPQDMTRVQLEMAILHKENAHWTDQMALGSTFDKGHYGGNWGGGHILVYSITDRLSFQDVQRHYESICRVLEDDEAKPAVILVGNKCDLEEYRRVTTEEGEALAKKWGAPFVETSAKERINHLYCFEEMVREIIRTIFEDPDDAVMLYANGEIPEFNVVMAGPGAVGKSSLTIMCLTGTFVEEYDPTIEDMYKKELVVDRHRVLLNIYDTAGQEEFSSMQDRYIRNTACKRIHAATAKEKHEQQKRLMDNIFGDLENLFYLLSDLVWLGMSKGSNYCVKLVKFILEIVVIYPLIIAISILLVLPSCFFLLFVRMSKIESDTKQVAVRQGIIEKESCAQRLCRIVNQLLRSLFMLSLLVIIPVVITYVIIPRTGNGENGADVIVIGAYLGIVLLLQLFGTWRGLKSFEAKKKETVNDETGLKTEFKVQTFQWNLGSIIAVVMLIWELLQMALFVYHTSKEEQEERIAQQEEDSEPFIQIENEQFIAINNGLKRFFEKMSYITFNFISSISLADYYMIFSIVFVGLLLSFFMFRFVFELRKYAKIKRGENDIEGSREFYFHSFIGTIIYGHGTLKDVNKFAAKLISLLSDTLFLGICEKLILLLLCTKSKSKDAYFMTLDPDIQCWSGKHQIYATLALILLGYYIPMCTMIAPMFDEVPGGEENEEKEEDEAQAQKQGCCNKRTSVAGNDEDKEEESRIKQLLSFDNDVDFVRPFVSAITVSKCFMLIGATYLFSGGVIGTIICQAISCLLLIIFTLHWSFDNLYLYGLTQNEPGFPFGICLIRVLGFFCGLCGCAVELLKYNGIIHSNLDFLALFVIMMLSAVIIGIVFVKYYRKYNDFDDNINPFIAITYDKDTKQLKLIQLDDQKD